MEMRQLVVVVALGMGLGSGGGVGVEVARAAPGTPGRRPIAGAAGARAAGARGAAGATLAELRKEVAGLRSRLVGLASLLDQVKDLHVRLVRIQGRLDRLERAAAAPQDLDRKITGVRASVRSLAQAVERLRLRRVRAVTLAAEAAAQGGGGGGVQAGYDGGFFVSSAGGRYRLVVNGVLRVRLRVGKAGGGGPLAPPDGGPVDLASMEVPNGLLMLSGNVFTKALTYHLEADLGGGGFTLWDFWFDYRPCSYFGITAGQFLVGYSHQQVLDPYDILFAEPTVAALLFGEGRDIGLRLHLHQWKDRVFEEVGVFNGGGMNALENDNLDFLLLVRAGIAPLGAVPGEEGDFRAGARPFRLLLTLGYFFLPMPTGRDLDLKEGMDNSFVHQAAAEVMLVARGFALNGELYYRYEDRGKAVTELDPPEERRTHRFGGYAQASYFIRRIQLAVGARYGYAEPVSFWHRSSGARVAGWSSPLELGGDTTTGLPDAVHEVGATVVFLAFHRHLKLTLGYTWLYEKGYPVSSGAQKPSRQVHLATLLAQARF